MEKWTTKLIIGFVALLLAAVLVDPLSTQGLSRTTTTNTTQGGIDISGARVNAAGDLNESYVLSLTTTGDTNNLCPITEYSIQSGNGTSLTETTDYVFDANAGTFTLVNTTQAIFGTWLYNYTNVTYIYCPTGYMNLAYGRTAINTTMGFFALAALLAAVALFYSAGRDLYLGK
jgi:hypothetical protein